jgi:hypothetical protein
VGPHNLTATPHTHVIDALTVLTSLPGFAVLCGRVVADLSLVTGRTVRQAFEVATTAAITETGALRDNQFLLMPLEGDHDVSIFADAEPGQ